MCLCCFLALHDIFSYYCGTIFVLKVPLITKQTNKRCCSECWHLHRHWCHHEDPSYQHRPIVLLGTAPDPECATFSATARTANVGPCIGHYQAGPLHLGPCRYCWLPAKPAAVCAERRCSAHLFSSGVRTHNPTASGPSLAMRTGANPVSVVCSSISLSTQHRTSVSGRQPVADIRGRFPSPSTLCRHNDADDAANLAANLQRSCGARMEQSASTD